jgi:hypothetical protein
MAALAGAAATSEAAMSMAALPTATPTDRNLIIPIYLQSVFLALMVQRVSNFITMPHKAGADNMCPLPIFG